MPSAGRDVLQLLQLAPGAFGDRRAQLRAAPRTCRRRRLADRRHAGIFATENGGQIVANGARTGENNYQIDGVGVTSVSWGGTTVITPNEDAIKEVKVITNNYDAENGRYRGAQVQIISQNGTNQSPRQRVLQVRQAGPERLSELQRLWPRGAEEHRGVYNDIGGTVGGPILRDKLFGFFSYETIRRPESPSIVQGWYQTPQYMAHGGAGRAAPPRRS